MYCVINYRGFLSEASELYIIVIIQRYTKAETAEIANVLGSWSQVEL